MKMGNAHRKNLNLYLELQSLDLNIKTGTGSIKRQYETCFQDAHSTLLNADINAANEPDSKKEGKQTTEDGERLAEGIHKSVVIGHLDSISMSLNYCREKNLPPAAHRGPRR